MSDLFLNGNFEVEINGNGDLSTVSGLERVKQSVAVHATAAIYPQIGEAVDAEKEIRRGVTTALRTHELLEEVVNIDIDQEQVGGGVYEVAIDFRTESFTFKVEG